MPRFRTDPVLLALAAGLAASTATSASVTYQIVALTGTDGPLGPGAGAGITFAGIGQQAATINSAGQIAFRAQESTPGVPMGIWLYSGGANINQVLAGSGYFAYDSIFNSTWVNNAGQTGWRLGAQTGVFADLDGNPQPVALTGDEAPDTVNSGPLATYQSVQIGMPLYNQSGQSIVVAGLNPDSASVPHDPPVVITSGIGNSTGIWAGIPFATHLVVRQNDPFLFLDPSGNTRLGLLINTNALSMSWNDSNAFVISVGLQGTNVVTGSGLGGNSTAILSNRSGSLAAIARANDSAPDATGAPGTDLYRSFVSSQGPAFNNHGRVVFNATLKDSTGVQTSNGALFTDIGTGVLHQYARAGQPLPTVYDAANNPLAEFSGVTWGINYFHPALNSSDVLVFDAEGFGNAGNGLATEALLELDASGRLHKIVRGGDLAIPHGGPFGDDVFFGSVQSTIQANSAGQVVFLTTLTGNFVNANVGNNLALYAYNLDGSLTLLARTGDSFLVAPGDSRTISGSGIGAPSNSGGQDGRLVAFNDSGDFVFELDFSDGSSALVKAHIPRPTTCYANCDGSTTMPLLNVADFTCFLQKFAANDPYANCDGSTTLPVLNVADFTCFLQKYAAGCQ